MEISFIYYYLIVFIIINDLIIMEASRMNVLGNCTDAPTIADGIREN